MKNKNEDEIHHEPSLWEALKELEDKHDCVIYGVLEIQGLEQDISDMFRTHVVQKLSTISKQEWKTAMQYAYDVGADGNAQDYELMVEYVHEYLYDTVRKPNPMNTLGGYSG